MLYNKLYGKITWKRTHTLMQWTWTWTNFGRWWRTGRAGVLQSLGLQRVGHDWVTEQQDTFMRKWITLLNTSKKKNKHAVQHRKSPLCYAVLSCSVMSNSLWPMAPQAPLSMGVFQARILEWAAMPSSRGCSQPRDRTHISRIAGRFFTSWATREIQVISTLI